MNENQFSVLYFFLLSSDDAFALKCMPKFKLSDLEYILQLLC